MDQCENWSTNEAGMIGGLKMHDGLITYLSFDDKDKSLKLRIRNSEGSVIELNGDQLDSLNISDFKEGNIISELFFWPIDKVPSETFDMVDSGWGGFFKGRALRESYETLAKGIVNSKSGTYLLQIQCSYGGTISAIVGGLSFYKRAI